MELTREQLIDCYECVFTNTHSDGFKSAEMKDLISNKNYWFLEKPKEDWESSLRIKLNEFGFEFDDLRK